MNVRYVYGAATAVLLTCAAPTVARAQTGSAEILPPGQAGVVTVAGCLTRGKGDHGIQYLLANPRPGPVANVPEGTCTPTIDALTLDLDKVHKSGLNESLVGHWVEINGRLERERHASIDNPREMGVSSFRVLPVVPPQVSVVTINPVQIQPAPAPEPTPAAEAKPEETAVATSGTAPAELPKTASPLPGIGGLGLLTLLAGLALRVSRRRARA